MTSTSPKKKRSYLYAVGRRKTSTARVRFISSTERKDGDVEVNGKPYTDIFSADISDIVVEPIKLIAQELGGYFTVKVSGGGVHSQVEAVRHGISRILVQMNADWKALLKAKGYLKRDPRVKERKKPGLKRARRSPQWSKR